MAALANPDLRFHDLKDNDTFTFGNLLLREQDLIGQYYMARGQHYKMHGRDIHRLGEANPFVKNVRTEFNPKVALVDTSSAPVEEIMQGVRGRVNSSTGTDPEIFVMRGKEKKVLLPAFKFLPTQEEQQLKFKDVRPNIGHIDNKLTAYAYRDGFAAECYVHPLYCHGYLINYIRDGLTHVLQAARKFDRTANLTLKNTFSISSATLNAADPADIALGCTPSLNAYDDNPTLPDDAREFRFRFAGGHAHFALPPNTKSDIITEMVKSCDALVGVASVALFDGIDTPVRRRFYGRAGEFRRPKHGLEYRVLSNAWLGSPEVAHLVLSLARTGLKIGCSGYRKHLEIEEQKVRDIINFCDVDEARKYVLSHLKMFEVLMTNDGIAVGPEARRVFKRAIEGGIQDVYSDFKDVEKNWLLTSGSWSGESNDFRATWGQFCMRASSTLPR